MNATRSVAVVTGGARGIGSAISRRLAEDGFTVVIADIDGAEDAAAQLRAAGHSALGLSVDVGDEASVVRMVDRTLEQTGQLDVLVNNAGIFTSLVPTPYDQLKADEWRRVLDVNVVGLFLCCREGARAMRTHNGGRIINIASAAPLKGLPLFLHYVSSKGAVLALTRALAREVVKDGILVNSVAPGFTISDGVEDNSDLLDSLRGSAVQNRLIERDQRPTDVAGVVSFLAGKDAAFMTGQTLVIDGGSVLH